MKLYLVLLTIAAILADFVLFGGPVWPRLLWKRLRQRRSGEPQ